MIIISHRGNLKGPDKAAENTLSQIEIVLRNYPIDVEIDIRSIDSRLYLGHDKAGEQISYEFLAEFSKRLWLHCKDLGAMTNLIAQADFIPTLNFFWHDEDDYTLTSKGFIWTYPKKETGRWNVIVETSFKKELLDEEKQLLGICTDYPLKYMECLK